MVRDPKLWLCDKIVIDKHEQSLNSSSFRSNSGKTIFVWVGYDLFVAPLKTLSLTMCWISVIINLYNNNDICQSLFLDVCPSDLLLDFLLPEFLLLIFGLRYSHYFTQHSYAFHFMIHVDLYQDCFRSWPRGQSWPHCRGYLFIGKYFVYCRISMLG